MEQRDLPAEDGAERLARRRWRKWRRETGRSGWGRVGVEWGVGGAHRVKHTLLDLTYRTDRVPIAIPFHSPLTFPPPPVLCPVTQQIRTPPPQASLSLSLYPPPPSPISVSSFHVYCHIYAVCSLTRSSRAIIITIITGENEVCTQATVRPCCLSQSSLLRGLMVGRMYSSVTVVLNYHGRGCFQTVWRLLCSLPFR